MRILSVRFKNIDSLSGETEIDFTDPARAGAGAAAAMAVCLALYGRAPRQPEAHGANGAIAPGAGDCFAEAVFETAESAGAGPSPRLQKYRAFWEQHRAHRRPDGALQTARHEIHAINEMHEEAGELLTAGIQEITGLTFDRFMRSAFLAQGEFSAFLQSASDERPSILERITGTEIYEQIPARVHEARNSERVGLSLLEAEMAAFKSLDAEGREGKENLEAKLAARLKDEAAAEKDLERYTSEFQWLADMEAVQRDLDMLEDRRQDLARRQDGFEPERKRLERAQQALELGSAYSALSVLRKEQEAEKRALLECQAAVPELETGVRRSEEALQIAVSAFSERQTELKNVQDLLNKVRELDLKHKEQEAPIEEAQADAARMAETAEKLKTKLDEDRTSFEKMQINLRDVRKFLQDRAADEKLIGQLDGIRARFDALGAAIDKRRRLSGDHSAAEKQKQEANNVLNGQSVLHETAKAKFTSLDSSIRKQQGSLDEMLAARTIAELKANLANIQERKEQQAQVEETLKLRQEAIGELQKLKARLEALNSSRLDCLDKIARQKETAGAAEKDALRMEGQQELLLRIKDMEEDRGRLREGEPCPLCGSAAHPYALGGIPDEEEIGAALFQARENLKQQLETLSSMQDENARLDRESLQAAEEETRRHSELQALESELTAKLAVLQLVLPMDLDPLAGIVQQQQRTEEALQKTRLTIERAEKIEEELSLAKEELERLREDREQLARSQQEAEFGRETASRELDRLAKEIRLHDEELKNVRLDLIHQIVIFGFKNLPDDQPEQVLEQLEERCRKWQENHQLRLTLEKQISAGERDLHHARSTLDNVGLEIKHKNDTVKKLRSEKDAIRQQRVSLFGEKDPDAEEAAHIALADAAQQQTDAKRKAREDVLQEFSSMRSRMEEMGKSIHIRAGSLHKAELSFKKRLLAHDFASEDSYLSACLSEAERKALQQRAQALALEKAELDAGQIDKKFEIEEVRRRHVTDTTQEEARERMSQASALLKDLRQSIGTLRLRLEDEEAYAQKRQERAIALEKQREECLRWENREKIQELLSSAGGHNRPFIQSLTLDMLIRQANRQLQKMANGYSLARDGELQLSDLSQLEEFGKLDKLNKLNKNSLSLWLLRDGQRRANLSGGENFIASLALALALSQTASQNVRVEPLFLRGSLGSLDGLDENSRGMALSALASLRLEGRLVAVISD